MREFWLLAFVRSLNRMWRESPTGVVDYAHLRTSKQQASYLRGATLQSCRVGWIEGRAARWYFSFAFSSVDLVNA